MWSVSEALGVTDLSLIKEVFIDATYNTNYAGAELYAIVGETLGLTVPLFYMLFEIPRGRKTMDGIRTQICTEFFGFSASYGLAPIFVHLDHSAGEILAAKSSWPNCTISLCVWHVDQAIKRRIQNADEEPHPPSRVQIDYTPNATWDIFVDEGPLEFINVDLINLHHEEAWNIYNQGRVGRAPNDPKQKTKQPTCADEKAREELLSLIRRHMLYHPIKHSMGQYGHRRTSIWRAQTMECWDVCKKWNTFYAWEYLWLNYYRPPKWVDWARSANLDYYPIIQTNAPVEGHWSELKRGVLKNHNRPQLDYLGFILISVYIEEKRRKLTLIRTFRERPSWHAELGSVWRRHQKTLHKAQLQREIEDQGEFENDDLGRTVSSTERYGTDTSQWICGCESYASSTYNICKHLVSLHPYLPSASEVVRQSTRPLLWIQGLHANEQLTTFVDIPTEMNGCEQMCHTIIVHEDTNPTMERDMLMERNREKLRGAEKIMLDFKEGYETLKYLLENYGPEHPHVSELPPTDDLYYGKWITYARTKAQIDRKRVRIPTWGQLRKGFRYYSINE
jgi:hypothetical protein